MSVEDDEFVSEESGDSPVARRFRGYLPVVVDVETGGFNAATDALLEIAAVLLEPDPDGVWHPAGSLIKHVQPFEGANLDPAALEFNGIDPLHPFRKQIAVSERDALQEIFSLVRKKVKLHGCKRAILVGHNAFFDLGFVNAAATRCGIKRNPFHLFSTLDTVTLAALAYGQTVLARAVQAAGMNWNSDEAHSALYDAERTADLFCNIVNRWKQQI